MLKQKTLHKKELTSGEELMEAMDDTIESLKNGDFKILV